MITNTNNRTLLSVSGTTYDFTFRIDAESELKVYGIDADDEATLLTTGFSIAFSAEDEEGTVTFDSEPSDYEQILMLRSKMYTQNTDIPIRAGFSEEDIENALDHIVMLIQQLKEITDHCVQTELTSEETGFVFPTPVEGNALVWDDEGNLVNSDEALVGPTGPTGPAGANGADGIFSAIASQAEAQAGSENTKGMTPLRVAEAIAALTVGKIYINAINKNTADATAATTVVTGVGFQPKWIFVWSAAIDSSTRNCTGYCKTATLGQNYIENAAGTYTAVNGSMVKAAVDGSNYQLGAVTAVGADGFTITWTKTGSPTGTANIYYIALA